jgi:2-desacetyl-2-hydroxyethyl bacteriochlorophyllide A dehydrogenase
MNLPTPEPGNNEVLIKVMASGICGTDIHILRREYMGDYPVIPGHEFSGIVEKVGSGVSRLHVGERVAVEPNLSCGNCLYCLDNQQNFCLNWQAIGVTLPGGMAEYVVVPEESVFSIGELAFEWGAFMEPLSCVLHGIERTGVGLGDRVAIIGAGPIGILLLQVVRLQGAVHVTVVEKQPARAAFAEAFGADQVQLDLDYLGSDQYDVVIDATGQVTVMERTTEFVRRGGKVLLFGVPPSGERLSLDAFEIFHKGLSIYSSFTSVRNSQQALSLLGSGRVDVSDLISHQFPLAEMQRGVDLIENGADEVKKVMIMPQA